MNLKKASLILIFGLIYIILHKVSYAIFPSLAADEVTIVVMNLLWIAANSALILFIFYFIKEVPLSEHKIRIPLYSVAICTFLIMMLKLPFGIISFDTTPRNLIFNILSLLNSVFVLAFLISLKNTMRNRSKLRSSVKLAIIAFAASVIVGIISLIIFAAGIRSMYMSDFQDYFRLISASIFLLTYLSLINFLLKLRKIRR